MARLKQISAAFCFFLIGLLAFMLLPLRGSTTCAFAPENKSQSTEILVVGGSPSGIAAAIAAARQGRHVILTETRPYLGTVLTSAMLNTFDMDRWYGERSTVQGIFEEFYHMLGLTFDPMEARRLFLEEVRKEPFITLCLETEFIRPIITENSVKGVLVRHGGLTREIYAGVVIDATDDADVAAASGVPYRIGRQESGIDLAMQPATLLFKLEGLNWNKVVNYIEDNDVPRMRGGVDEGYAWGYSALIPKYRPDDPQIETLDLNIGLQPDGSAWINALQIFKVDGTNHRSREEAYERASKTIPPFVEFLNRFAPGFKHARLVEIAPELYIRETRHISGLRMLTARDILKEHIFWDRIAVASYPIDLHPYRRGETNPFRAQRHVYTIPLRSLIAMDIDNLFVASRSFSATYEAAGSARVIPTTIALGQAAGTAAAVCVERELSPHSLVKDKQLVRIVQERLTTAGVQLNL